MNRRLGIALATAALVGSGTACSSHDEHSAHADHTTMSMASSAASNTSSAATHDMSGMHHRMDGGPAPAGMTPATSPRFPVGSKVTLTADHMDGMKGAPATVVGAYTTTAYAVNYRPTTGGAMVENHKWVVQQEIANSGSERLADGTEITLTADHMDGMKDARGTVASSTTQTVYLVDYTADGMTMKNHKWVVENEMTPR